jgi:hypothetical protein
MLARIVSIHAKFRNLSAARKLLSRVTDKDVGHARAQPRPSNQERTVPVSISHSGTVECQVGAKKYTAQYSVMRGKVTVTCELGSRSGDLKFFKPEFIAKTLLLELAERKPG